MDGITDEHDLSYVFTRTNNVLQASTGHLVLVCEAHSGDFSAVTEQYCTQSATVATVTLLNGCVQNKN